MNASRSGGWTIAVGSGFLGAAFMALFWMYQPGASNSADMAAWVQAGGAIVAICGSVAIAQQQQARTERNRALEVQGEKQRAIALSREAVNDALLALRGHVADVAAEREVRIQRASGSRIHTYELPAQKAQREANEDEERLMALPVTSARALQFGDAFNALTDCMRMPQLPVEAVLPISRARNLVRRSWQHSLEADPTLRVSIFDAPITTLLSTRDHFEQLLKSMDA
jgi:hypothetical protein